MTDEHKTLEELFEDNEAISYDTETGQFTIEMLDDVDTMYEYYKEIPILRKFIQREVGVKRELVHDLPRENVTGYEVMGFLWFHAGEEYTIDPESYL